MLRSESRSRIHLTVYVVALIIAGLGRSLAADEKPSAVDYVRDVEPILRSRCFSCHGPRKQESGLRVDLRSHLLRGGDSGEPALISGKPDKSYFIQLVSGEIDDLVMPPKGKRLAKLQIDILRRWVEQGAKVPRSHSGDSTRLTTNHWSFQPIGRRQPPTSKTNTNRPIDAFIVDKLQQARLSRSPRADKQTLIRRLFLVVHGLPPTQKQVDDYVKDRRPNAWARLVEQVLASPRYGERLAMQWLDLIRFGETHGFETNRERIHAWSYRDWVIKSFNDDKPYDKFVSEQIAGDALGEPIGTGFLVAGPHDLVKSPDINLTLMQRQDELADLINTTSTALLGLTVGCARCHNHKFDPITQRDYYSIQAVFAGVQHGDKILAVPAGRKTALAQMDREIATLRRQLEVFIPTADSNQKALRESVTAHKNIERIKPTKARFVRFTILATNTRGEPCIDELEVFSQNKNLALASLGAKATSSGNFPNNRLHKLEHVNDGRYGNGRSWISNERSRGWVQIELAKPAVIDVIVWARDRQMRYRDRLATKYRIEAALVPGKWQVVASSNDRVPFNNEKKSTEPKYDFKSAKPREAAQGRNWFARLRSALKQRTILATTPTVYAGKFSQPGPTHRLYRGEPMAKREQVAPDAIEVMGSLGLAKDSPEQQRRLKFAAWIANRDNPLTARVIVNRLWQFHFGTGLVDTPSDFGANGTQPTHPKLLDWLARDFMDHGWSIKHVNRQILLSQTWQQDSRPRANALQTDAASRLLWRFPIRRLQAEAIRDSMLSVAGVLDLTMGGPGFSGFEVQMENVRHYFPKKSYGTADWRRMIYMTKVRQESESVFGAFDCPDASQVTPQRGRSTTPLQALNLLNSIFVNQQAQLFANRLRREAGESPSAQVRLAFRLCYSRDSTEDELTDSIRFIETDKLEQFARALLNSNELLFIQ